MGLSKRSELMLGVWLGLYGNWLITIIDKIELEQLSSVMLLIFSFFPFALYFAEIFSQSPTVMKYKFFNKIPLHIILGALHIFLVYFALEFAGLLLDDFLLSASGLLFWIGIMNARAISNFKS